VLHVAPRDPAWRGTEQVVLSLSDSTGRKASRALSYTVTDGVPVSLTFVQGRLFSVGAGETKIVIDGLLRDAIAFSPTEKARLARAEAPFDRIALALATHEHYDHVTPEFVVEHLTSSRSTLFASLTETVDLLECVPGYAAIADRVVGIPFEDGRSADLYLAGVHVTAFSSRHGGESAHLAFVTELGGAKILVLSDGSFDFAPAELVAAYGWPSLDIDVAIVPPWWVGTLEGTLLTQGIAPRFVIAGPLLRCPPFVTIPEGSPIPVFVCDRVKTWILPPRAPSSGDDQREPSGRARRGCGIPVALRHRQDGPGRDAAGEPDAAPDDGAAPDRHVPQNGGSGVEDDVVLHDRVPRAALHRMTLFVRREAERAESDPLIHAYPVSDHRGFADHHARSVVDEQPLADLRSRVDVDPRLAVRKLGDHPRDERDTLSVKLVGQSVVRDR
jgi:hypothetical protein